MIELSSKQFLSLTGRELVHLLRLTGHSHSYRAVLVEGVRVWVWRQRGGVCVSSVIGPQGRKCGLENERVRTFREDNRQEVTQEYLERLGYRVEVKASGYTLWRGDKVVEDVDNGKNIHARYALREVAVNRRVAWARAKEDYKRRTK